MADVTVASLKESKGAEQPLEVAEREKRRRENLRQQQLQNMLRGVELAEGEVGRVASAFGDVRSKMAEASQKGQKAIKAQMGKALATGTTRGTRQATGMAIEAGGETATRIANFLSTQREREAGLAMDEQREMSRARQGALQASLKATDFERQMGDDLSDLRQESAAINEIIAATPQGVAETDGQYAARVASIAASEGYAYDAAHAAATRATKGSIF